MTKLFSLQLCIFLNILNSYMCVRTQGHVILRLFRIQKVFAFYGHFSHLKQRRQYNFDFLFELKKRKFFVGRDVMAENEDVRSHW